MKRSNKVKDVNIKNRTYYFFNDVIDIENFDPNYIKIDENWFKSMKNCGLKSNIWLGSVTKNSYDYDYDEKYIKIKFDSDDELLLNKTIEICTITIVVTAAILENSK